MPRFQPGPHRYFGTTARPTSSITASLLPVFRGGQGPAGLRRPMRPVKAIPYTIGKTERVEITKKLLKMPNYVPQATTRALKTFAKGVMTHQKQFSKEERAFASATLHSDRTIKSPETQKKFIEGEVAALVDIKDRRVKDTFRFAHHGQEVAGQTLRGLIKEKKEKEAGPSVSEKRASLRSRSDAPMTPDAPAASTWTAPVPLDADAGAGQTGSEVPSGWPAPFGPAHHAPIAADDVHGVVLPGLSSVSASSNVDLLILSDRLSDADIATWSKVLNLRIRRLPLSTLPLIHAFPSLPATVVVEAGTDTDLTQLKLPVGVSQTMIFLPEGTTLPTQIEPPAGQKITTGELKIEAIRQLFSSD